MPLPGVAHHHRDGRPRHHLRLQRFQAQRRLPRTLSSCARGLHLQARQSVRRSAREGLPLNGSRSESEDCCTFQVLPSNDSQPRDSGNQLHPKSSQRDVFRTFRVASLRRRRRRRALWPVQSRRSGSALHRWPSSHRRAEGQETRQGINISPS